MECPNCGNKLPGEMKYCGNCGEKVAKACHNCSLLSPLDYNFCGHCGTTFAAAPDHALSLSTINQYAPSTEEELIQPDNGAQVEPASGTISSALSGERRQASVLVADVKSSTSILEQIGSEAWVELMNRVLQIMSSAIYRFGGVVDQFRGDGLVAFFGARLAHEDDSERAVMAALVMQHDLKAHADLLADQYDINLLVRVGINTGEVITTNVGADAQHSEDTAMGGAVTLAARLEAAAEPGTILVSEYTYRLVEPRFKWEPLGGINARGISQPVNVYRPLRPIFETEQQHRLQAYGLATPMVGRDHELNAITATISALRDGRGAITLISGDAGMGKSRLIFEARQRIERDEALMGAKECTLTWLQGRCRSYGQTLLASMWVDLWQRWLGMGHWISPEEALERLRRKANEFWPDHIEEYYPYLAAFLSLPLEERYATRLMNLDAEQLRHRFFKAVRSWLEIMSQQNPLVVVFSEAHWADDISLELLKFCLPLCVQERIVFVVVFRPERKSTVWNFKHYVETKFFHRLVALELPPLSDAQSIELIQQMVGFDALPEYVRTQILEKSNGNPFYLTEIIQSLIDRGILIQDEKTKRWRTLRDEVPLSLPDTLKSLLLSRIDIIAPDERQILQLAAVIGPIFWFNVLEPLVKDKQDLRSQLIGLQRAQLITERGLLEGLGREYAFNTTLIREAAYDSILSSQREGLHLSVANILEQLVKDNNLQQYHGIIAYHYRQARNCQKDLAHTMAAAREAVRIHANAEAIQAYEHAFSLIGPDSDEDCVSQEKSVDEWKLEILRGLGQIKFGIGKVQQAEHHFREAIALGRRIDLPANELTRLFYWLGEVLFWKNSYEEPLRLGEEGLALLDQQKESVEAALMNQLVALGCSQLGDHDKFIDFTLRTAGFLQRLSYSEELRPAFVHIISLYGYTLKNLSEARRWLEILRQRAEENQDLRALGEYYEYSAGLAFQEGSIDIALQKHQTAIEKFSQLGDSKHLSRAWKSLGIVYLQMGELKQALECLNNALEHASVFGNEADYTVGNWYKGQVLLCQKDYDGALAAFERASSVVQEVPFLQKEWTLSGIGRVYLAQGMGAKALQTFQQALQHTPSDLFRYPYQAYEILSGLEASFAKPEGFRAYIEQFRQEHPELDKSAFKYWYLNPTEINYFDREPLYHEVFNAALDSGWIWTDLFMDCSYQVQKDLIIRAANERNLYHANRSAPRLLREEPSRGDFTVQLICQPGSNNKPSIGGLLVWLNDKYWFCLEAGGRGPGEILLRGFMNNHDLVFARGRMRSRKIHLRLERRGNWLSAYSSAGGKNWFLVGGCELSSIEPLYLGLHAIGHINRLVYPGKFVHGTAIRFNEFWLWNS